MPAAPPGAGDAPLKRLDGAWYRAEQRIVEIMLSVMGVVVFLDVVHRVASRERGLFHRLLGDAPWAGVFGSAVIAAIGYAVVYGGLRTRGDNAGWATHARALALTAGTYVAIRVLLVVVPNGLVWSQTLGLALMLWVGCLGASTAAHDGRHLALDVGSKIWPKAALPKVQAVGNFVTAGFCWVLALLAAVSVGQHYGDFTDTGGAGGRFVALPIPLWMAFLIIPFAFTVMGVRFAAQGVASLRGRVEEEDALQMLGIKDLAEKGPGSGDSPPEGA